MIRSMVGAAPVVNAKPVRTRDYSVEVQWCGPAALPAIYRNLHLVTVFLAHGAVVVRKHPPAPTAIRFGHGEGSIHPVGPGHAVEWPSGVRCLHVHLHPRLIRDLSCEQRISLERHPRVRDPVIRDVGLQLHRLVRRPGPRDLGRVHELILALAHHLVRSYAAEAPLSARIGRLTVEAVMDAFRDDVRGWDGVTTLAERAGLSQSHFTRQVRRVIGLPPRAMVVGSRVEAVKNLLELPDVGLSDVAYRTGFADQSHLTRVFKRLTGVTPAGYRSRRS